MKYSHYLMGSFLFGAAATLVYKKVKHELQPPVKQSQPSYTGPVPPVIPPPVPKRRLPHSPANWRN